MKQLISIFLVCALGCAPSVPSLAPEIDEVTGLKMAFELSFVVENAESRPIGCATLLAKENQSFLLAAPLELVNQAGCRFVEWRGEYDGQKFVREAFTKFDLLISEPKLKVAVLRIAGATSKHPIGIADTEGREFYSTFKAYSSRASQPKPIEAMSVKVSGLSSARTSNDQPAANFLQVESTLDFKILGSPLVTQQGELAGVAVGNFWESTLYCPASSILRLLSASNTSASNSSP